MVLDVVIDVNRARDRQEFLRVALAGAVRCLPCLVASVNEVDPAAGRYNYCTEPPPFPLADNAAETFARLAPEHPLTATVLVTADTCRVEKSVAVLGAFLYQLLVETSTK